MKAKAILNDYMAKRLLKAGNEIIDLQPNKYLQNATVFIFKDTEKLRIDLKYFTEQDKFKRKDD